MAKAAPAIAVMASGSRSPLHSSPSRSRRYSSDDIGCRYSSLSHTHLMPPLAVSHLGSSEGSLPRRQSVAATVQTEERYRSPRQLQHRRRSEFSAHEKRRRSRAELDNMRDAGYRDAEALNGGRRGTRASQMLNAYDLDSARLSVSSGRHRKTSRHSTPPREEDPEERRRSRVVLVCASVAVAIFLIAILLVAVTLRLTPTIDEMGEYQHTSLSVPPSPQDPR